MPPMMPMVFLVFLFLTPPLQAAVSGFQAAFCRLAGGCRIRVSGLRVSDGLSDFQAALPCLAKAA